MMRKVLQILAGLAVVGFSAWLFFYDEAAMPGPLSPSHRAFDDCRYCHMPWKGVSESKCLMCHRFTDIGALPQVIRFHEAKGKCLRCHQEHGLLEEGISKMDHRLLNEELFCSMCHFDAHRGLFGEACRECHRISTWNIRGFRHPSGDRKDCSRCHTPPSFHRNPRCWQGILEGMEFEKADPEECWRCHTVNQWPKMNERIGR